MPIKRGSDTFLVTIKDCLDQSFDPVRLVASSHQSFISPAFDSSRKLSHFLYQSNHGSTARSALHLLHRLSILLRCLLALLSLVNLSPPYLNVRLPHHSHHGLQRTMRRLQISMRSNIAPLHAQGAAIPRLGKVGFACGVYFPLSLL